MLEALTGQVHMNCDSRNLTLQTMLWDGTLPSDRPLALGFERYRLIVSGRVPVGLLSSTTKHPTIAVPSTRRCEDRSISRPLLEMP
jgi:hypothetical protein